VQNVNGEGFFVVWASCYCPLLGRTRSWGRCWAIIRLSHRPEPSGSAVDGLDIGGQHGRRGLMSENTRKNTSIMTLLDSRKMERISRKGVLCMKTLANSCMKPFQLKQHLNSAHMDQARKLIKQFQSKEGCLKCVRLDARSAFNQAYFSIPGCISHCEREEVSYYCRNTCEIMPPGLC